MIRDFLALAPESEEYYTALAQRCMNAKFHLRRIIALVQIYEPKDVACPGGIFFEDEYKCFNLIDTKSPVYCIHSYPL